MANYKGICLLAGLALGSISAVLPAHAQNESGPVLNPDVPLEYVVKKGDTLWDIAEYFLRDPWMWPELWNANPQVENPHLIFPDEVLYLVWVDGKPRLQREAPAPAAQPASKPRSSLARVSPQVRRTPLDAAIPTIPLKEIQAFLRGPRVMEKDHYDDAPHVVSFSDDRLLGSDGADAYVKGTKQADGYNYGVVRRGDKYRDPDDGDVLGYEAIPVGKAVVEQFGKVSVARLLETNREVLKMDRLVPAHDIEFRTDFFPSAPEEDIDGKIISVFDGVSQIGQYQIVTLNRGLLHGLRPGHILSVKQAGKKVKDPNSLIWSVQLPDIDAGQLMVFKTFDRLSYGLIMRATRPIHVLDKVANPSPGA